MARPRYPRSGEPLPPPLPPGERTVGQLVAETLRLYGRHFWRALPLGLSVALVNQVTFHGSTTFQALVLAAAAPLLAASYVGASVLVLEKRPAALRLAIAAGVGAVVFVPVAFLTLLYVLPALAWLALVGLVVPVLIAEDVGPREALRRAVRLGRADYVHMLGGLATLVILVLVTKVSLVVVLQTTGDQTNRIAVFLADLVLSPILFLGSALLYTDQAARLIDSASPRRTRRRTRDADLHPADDPHRPGRADAQVQSESAARGER